MRKPTHSSFPAHLECQECQPRERRWIHPSSLTKESTETGSSQINGKTRRTTGNTVTAEKVRGGLMPGELSASTNRATMPNTTPTQSPTKAPAGKGKKPAVSASAAPIHVPVGPPRVLTRTMPGMRPLPDTEALTPTIKPRAAGQPHVFVHPGTQVAPSVRSE